LPSIEKRIPTPAHVPQQFVEAHVLEKNNLKNVFRISKEGPGCLSSAKICKAGVSCSLTLPS